MKPKTMVTAKNPTKILSNRLPWMLFSAAFMRKGYPSRAIEVKNIGMAAKSAFPLAHEGAVDHVFERTPFYKVLTKH